MRQDDAARHDRRAPARVGGTYRARRSPGERWRAARYRLSVPARRAAAVEDGAAERGAAAHDPRTAGRRNARAGRRVAAPGRPRRLRVLLSAPALGRHAQARVAGDDADLWTERITDGRAVQRARRADAQPHGEPAPGALGGD